MDEKKKKLSGLILTGFALAGIASTAAADKISADFSSFFKDFKGVASRGLGVFKTGFSKLRDVVVRYPKLSAILLGASALVSVGYYNYYNYKKTTAEHYKKTTAELEVLKQDILNPEKNQSKEKREGLVKFFNKLSTHEVHCLYSFYSKIKDNLEAKTKFIHLITADEEVADKLILLLDNFNFNKKSAQGLVSFLECDKENCFINLLKSKDFVKDAVRGLAYLLEESEGLGSLSLSTFVNLFKDNEKGEMVADELAVLLRDDFFNKNTAKGLVLLLGRHLEDEKEIKQLLRYCYDKNATGFAKLLGSYEFNYNAAEKLIMMFKAFDEEASMAFMKLIGNCETINTPLSLIKDNNFDNDAAKGFACFFKEANKEKNMKSVHDFFKFCLEDSKDAISGLVYLLKNFGKTNNSPFNCDLMENLTFNPYARNLRYLLANCNKKSAEGLAKFLKKFQDFGFRYYGAFWHFLAKCSEASINGLIECFKDDGYSEKIAERLALLIKIFNNGDSMFRIFQKQQSVSRFISLLNSEDLDVKKFRDSIDVDFLSKELQKQNFNAERFIEKQGLKIQNK